MPNCEWKPRDFSDPRDPAGTRYFECTCADWDGKCGYCPCGPDEVRTGYWASSPTTNNHAGCNCSPKPPPSPCPSPYVRANAEFSPQATKCRSEGGTWKTLDSDPECGQCIVGSALTPKEPFVPPPVGTQPKGPDTGQAVGRRVSGSIFTGAGLQPGPPTGGRGGGRGAARGTITGSINPMLMGLGGNEPHRRWLISDFIRRR